MHEKKEDEVWGAEEGVMDFNLEIMTTGLYQHDNEENNAPLRRAAEAPEEYTSAGAEVTDER